MTAPTPRPVRPRPWSPIQKNLGKLNRAGLRNPPLHVLGPLVEVARGISPAATDRDKVIDALAQAIDACWGGASGAPPSLRDTMRLWFGLPSVDDPAAPDTSALGSVQRRKIAWEYWVGPELLADDKLKEAEETFRTNKARDRYAALAQRLVDLEADPPRSKPSTPTPLALPQPPSDEQKPVSASEDGTLQRPAERLPTRRVTSYFLSRRVGAVLALVVAVAAAIAAWAPWSSRRGQIPPDGAIVNAQTGAWTFNAPKTPAEFPTGLGGGQQVLVCDLSSSPACHHHSHSTLVEPVKVHVGDRLELVFILNNGYTNAIPYLSLSATVNYLGFSPTIHTRISKRVAEQLRRAELEKDLSVVVRVAWPSTGSLGSGPVTTREAGIHEAILQLPTPGNYSLRYLPGTSALYLDHPRFFHYLPDGIMGPGIALQDVGEPAGCYPCDVKYIRVVRFEVQVTTRATA
jgi:hypothetical protein